MQAWAFVPWQTYLCHVSCHRLMPVKASSTVFFPLNLEIPYGDVNDTTGDWSKHHDSSPLEKRVQAAWDDLACRDTLNSLLNTNNPWNHCRLLAAQESHSAAWSKVFPIASVGNLLSSDELCIAIAL